MARQWLISDQHHVALMIEEVTAGEIADEGLVDRGLLEVEFVYLLGEREPGDGHLVLDRARLLLADLCREQVADDLLGFLLPLHGGGNDLVIGRVRWRP